MTDPVLSVSYATIAAFFEAAEGNYRNAVYVSCACDYQKESGCGDFLFIPGHDCRPVLLPLSDAETFMGATIDRTDCSCVMDSRCFIRLYSKWIELSTPSSKDCPIHQILHLMNRPPVP